MNYYDYPGLSVEQKATYQTLAILENSAAHQRLKQVEAEAFVEQQKQQAENERLAAWHLEDSRRQRAAEEEVKRKEASAYFEQNLREQFFAKNPHVSESDYLSVKDELKRQAMLTNMDFGNKAEETTKQQGNYLPM